MEKFELASTDENVCNTFLNNTLNRNADLFNFIRILHLVEGNSSISLDGKWGSGKTFFIKQINMIINSFHKKNDKILEKLSADLTEQLESKKSIAVYYDAWANDDDDDPLLSLLFVVLKNLELTNLSEDFKFNLENTFVEIVKVITSFDISKITDRNNILSKIEAKKNLESKVKKMLDDITSIAESDLIILVDELDRCKPDYAVKMLERIKHYFSNNKIKFVFAINSEELQHTINKFYGDKFDSARYLNRFFNFKIRLPRANSNYYVGQSEFVLPHAFLKKVLSDIIEYLDLELRDASNLLEQFRIADNSQEVIANQGRTSLILFIDYILAPVLFALKIARYNDYINFVNASNNDVIIEIMSQNVKIKDCINTCFDFKEGLEVDNDKWWCEKVTTIISNLQSDNDSNSSPTLLYGLVIDADVRSYFRNTVNGLINQATYE